MSDTSDDGTLIVSGNVGIGTSSPQKKLHVYAGSSSSEVLWPLDLQNSYNHPPATGYGVGLRLKNSSYSTVGNGDEPFKWAGIAAIAESDWSIATGLRFYTQADAHTTPHDNPTVKMAIKGDGSIIVGGETFYEPTRLNVKDGQLTISGGSNNPGVLTLRPSQNGSWWNIGNIYNGTKLAIRAGDLTNANDTTSWDNSRLIINDDGKVGIGTTNPQAKLEVNGSFYPKITVEFFQNDWDGCIDLGEWAFCVLAKYSHKQWDNEWSKCSVHKGTSSNPTYTSYTYSGKAAGWRICNTADGALNTDCAAMCLKFE